MNVGHLLNGQSGMATAAVVAAVGLGLTSAQTPTMAAPTGPSEIAKLAAAGGVDALQQLLDVRSPGFRAPGALTQTKARRIFTLKEAFGPKERVLSEARTRPTVPGERGSAAANDLLALSGPDLFTPAGPAIAPGGDAQAAISAPLPDAGGSFPTPGADIPPIIVGGGGGAGGGGGGGNGGGGTGGGGTPGVGGAVPEPATWATLLIGFFAIGFGLRGRAASTSRRWRAAF